MSGMKIAIITDTHFGVRNDSEYFLNKSKLFLDNIFFPYLKKENINTVFHLGDIVDRRKYINFNTSKRIREDFLIPLYENKIETHIILGNHDIYYKNINDINAVEEIIDKRFDNFKVYYQPLEITICDVKILMLPWICEQNKELTHELIKNTKSQICMGHLELNGFEMFKGGSVCDHGIDRKIFDKFDIVCSGHFHHKSTSSNIHYLGTPYEMTWSDFDDPKGFHILDLSTRELNFIQNPFKTFKKIFYDDKDKDSLEENEIKNCKDSIVKVVVTHKENPYLFDKFIDLIEEASPQEYQIVEYSPEYEKDNDEIDEAESTLDIFKQYIQKSEIKGINKTKLEKTIIDLYNEAINLE